jgi:hypothetical protein
MTMKTRNTCIAAAIFAAMACSAAHAQVLGGGSLSGGLDGTLGGGLHDTRVLTNGNAAGSFGGELDTGSVASRAMGRARGAADQATTRARSASANARTRAQSTVSSARDTSANVATSTVDAAHSAKDSAAAQLDSASVATGADSSTNQHLAFDNVTSDVTGSASGNASASRKGVVADAAADADAIASIDAPKQDAPVAAAQQDEPKEPKKNTSNR